MKKAYLGIDIGSISTKGVVIDKNNNIIASSYNYTNGNPIKATKKVIRKLENKLDKSNYKVVGVGTTGSSRKLIGAILEANVIKNEITANATAATSIYPDVHTVIESGGHDAKVIQINNGTITDYAIIAFEDSFIDSICQEIKPPVVLQGGLSKNNDTLEKLKKKIDYNIIVNENAHLMGALGVAILSKKEKEVDFSLGIENIEYNICGLECKCCSKNCQVIKISKDDTILKAWGNKCSKGIL